MGCSAPPPPPPLLLLLSLSVLLSILSCLSEAATFKGIDLENPVINVIPSPLASYKPFAIGSNDVLLCGRVRIAGQSRLKLGSYATAYQVTLAPSVVIPERLYNKIQICFHQNASRSLCQCGRDEWKAVRSGVWSSVMSPYEVKYLDVKFAGDISGSVTVTVKEEFQIWRLLCLALGFTLLLLAPVVSSWVPFYYSSLMAIGVLLVIIIVLFQGMKLLPTGRKSALFFTLYGSVLGAGSFLLHHFSMLVISVLVNFGLSVEMHNPVSVSVLLSIVLAGAALGYWIVRKFIISDDGSVDGGIAQFVKWAMRVIAIAFIFQSTLDTPLAMGALASCLAICSLFTSSEWNGPYAIATFGNSLFSGSGSPWRRGVDTSSRGAPVGDFRQMGDYATHRCLYLESSLPAVAPVVPKVSRPSTSATPAAAPVVGPSPSAPSLPSAPTSVSYTGEDGLVRVLPFLDIRSKVRYTLPAGVEQVPASYVQEWMDACRKLESLAQRQLERAEMGWARMVPEVPAEESEEESDIEGTRSEGSSDYVGDSFGSSSSFSPKHLGKRVRLS